MYILNSEEKAYILNSRDYFEIFWISITRTTSQPHVTHGQPENSTPDCQQAIRAAPTACLTVRKPPSPSPTQRQTLGSATPAIWISPPSANLIRLSTPTNSIAGCKQCWLNMNSLILLTWISRPLREEATPDEWLMESCSRSWPRMTPPTMLLQRTLL